MKSSTAKALLDQIDTAIIDIQGFPNSSTLEQSYFAKFLVVFICGIYEEAIETIINERMGRLNFPPVSKFIEKALRRWFRNPDISNIKKFVNDFDQSWGNAIDQLSQQSKTVLDSIVQDKNSLAHGNTCNITLNDIVQFYRDSRVVIETLDNIIL